MPALDWRVGDKKNVHRICVGLWKDPCTRERLGVNLAICDDEHVGIGRISNWHDSRGKEHVHCQHVRLQNLINSLKLSMKFK